MEPKQILMLTVLLLIALIGCATLVYVMMNLDNKEDGDDSHGGHGH